jgi:hypothetical protein
METRSPTFSSPTSEPTSTTWPMALVPEHVTHAHERRQRSYRVTALQGAPFVGTHAAS